MKKLALILFSLFFGIYAAPTKSVYGLHQSQLGGRSACTAIALCNAKAFLEGKNITTSQDLENNIKEGAVLYKKLKLSGYTNIDQYRKEIANWNIEIAGEYNGMLKKTDSNETFFTETDSGQISENGTALEEALLNLENGLCAVYTDDSESYMMGHINNEYIFVDSHRSEPYGDTKSSAHFFKNKADFLEHVQKYINMKKNKPYNLTIFRKKLHTSSSIGTSADAANFIPQVKEDQLSKDIVKLQPKPNWTNKYQNDSSSFIKTAIGATILATVVFVAYKYFKPWFK